MVERSVAITLEQLRARRDEILAIAARYGATNVRIFGSVVRNENTDLSDIDLMVDLERKWTLWDRIGLMQDLEDL
ncbi:MAG: nucleotidyltransferase domain-containing protein, partial [Anaerolineae bacterium]|nr:nucleotidyltransferase domain-containing protein [Anaerolineae bacterium]